MPEKYCAKCDIVYQTPEGEKGIDGCPFCSLGDFKHDNLAAKDKIKVINTSVKNWQDKV
jgi:hypothetical protein